MPPVSSILFAGDRQSVLEALRSLLEPSSWTVHAVRSVGEVETAIRERQFDLVLIDLDPARDPASAGLDEVSRLTAGLPWVPIVVMTAREGVQSGLEAMRRGARDYVETPWNDKRLLATLRTYAELGRVLRGARTLEAENARLRDANAALSRRATGHAQPGLEEMTLDDAERHLIRRALERTDGNVKRAAQLLGVSRATLYRRLERHGISPL